jgi:hypothetical protein
MPFKVWADNDFLLAAEVNDYLMEQSVIRCTSGTRPSAPNDGMLVYETDTNWYVSYNPGVGWRTLGQMITGTYTPTLTGSGGNPNLGSTGTAEARWTIWNGKWCLYRGSFQWGGSGMTAGSGQYLVSAPFTSSTFITNGVSCLGQVFFRDNSAGPALRTGACYITTSQTTLGLFEATTGLVTGANPWTWAGSGDYISWEIAYEIA